jgi:hypothetical protein
MKKNSISINQRTYDEIEKVLSPLARSAPVPSVRAMKPSPISCQVTRHPDNATGDSELSAWTISRLLGQHQLRQTRTLFVYDNVANGSVPGSQAAAVSKGKKRAAPEDVDKPLVVAKIRKARSYPRCKKTDCEGRFKSKPCNISTVSKLSLTIRATELK